MNFHHKLYDKWGWGERSAPLYTVVYCSLYRKIYFPNQYLNHCFFDLSYSEKYQWCRENCVEDSWTTWNNKNRSAIGFGFKNKKEFLHFKMVWM